MLKSIVAFVDVVAVLAAEVVTLGIGALLGKIVDPGSAAVKNIISLRTLWLSIGLISLVFLG